MGYILGVLSEYLKPTLDSTTLHTPIFRYYYYYMVVR